MSLNEVYTAETEWESSFLLSLSHTHTFFTPAMK